MKTVIYYDCEICGRRHDDKALAAACEKRGRPKRVLRIGVGWEYLHHEDHRDGTDGVILVVARVIVDGHTVGYPCWGFRDNGAGDNGPDANEREYGKGHAADRGMCGSGSVPNRESRPNTRTKRWRRARAELARHGIKLIRWDGTDKCFGPAPEPEAAK